MYHANWADWYLPAAMPALERLFFGRLAAGSRVLDVCCGSAHVTKELARRGYVVTGIDSSAALIEIARRDLPGIDFRVADVRNLRLEERYDAALSTFDSLNHLMTLEDLRAAFTSVHAALKPGGLFVFDMNLEDAYLLDLRQWTVSIKEDEVGLVRGLYDTATKKASTELIWFVRSRGSECWRQHRSVVDQRCYSETEILSALAEAGFTGAKPVEARNAGMDADLGMGRMFISARA